MFNFFKGCIFCTKPLPKEQKGYGEHPIPKNIFGFWHIYDVCEKCKEYFGDNIDQLSLKNLQILSALDLLKLSKADLYFDNLPYCGRDSIDGRKVKIVRRGSKVRTKAQFLSPNIFECDEEDWERIGVDWVRKNVDKGISEDDFNKEIKRLKNKYETINAGETISSDLLGHLVKKGTVTDIQVDSENLPSISKLIAKIVFCFIHYILNREQIVNIREYLMIRNYARYDGELKDYTINWCPLVEKVSYHKFHRIWLQTLSNSNTLLVDTTLFGYPSWRTVLTSNIPIELKDSKDKRIDEIMFILDFKNLNDRLKHIGFKYSGSKNFNF